MPPAQRVKVKGEDAEYAVTLSGAIHIKNPTHRAFLLAQKWVTPNIRYVTKKELAELLEIEDT